MRDKGPGVCSPMPRRELRLSCPSAMQRQQLIM